MPRYGMTTPQGESIYYPEPDWLRDKLLNAGPEFWNVDSGEAEVEFGREGIYLVFHEKYGFALGYHDAQNEGYVPWMQDSFGDSVEVWVGGSPWYYPQAEFVPRDLACAVVEEFCVRGGRSELIRWKSTRDIRWDGTTGRHLE